MYDVRPNTLIGFHGCDLDIRNKLVNNPDYIEISKNNSIPVPETYFRKQNSIHTTYDSIERFFAAPPPWWF